MQLVAVLALTLVAARAFGEVSESYQRATHLESRTRLVQGRVIDRNWRFELGVNYGPTAFGDSYLNTQTLGGSFNIHITPKFSLGVQYAKAFNQLTAEGQTRFNQAQVEISYPTDQVMGVINWYMTYGKINLFDWRTVQFDIYSLAGYGQINTARSLNGTSSGHETLHSGGTWTAGVGLGLWLAKHLTSRFEIRYQNYSDKSYSGSRDMNLIIGTFGLGVLL
jgi:outer membrane beta-barrel protein